MLQLLERVRTNVLIKEKKKQKREKKKQQQQRQQRKKESDCSKKKDKVEGISYRNIFSQRNKSNEGRC